MFINRSNRFSHRRWTVLGPINPNGVAVRHRAQREGTERHAAHRQSEEPRFPQNGRLTTQTNCGLLTKGEMNEAAQAVDTFIKNKRTRLPRVHFQGCWGKSEWWPVRCNKIGWNRRTRQARHSCKGVLEHSPHRLRNILPRHEAIQKKQ